jgi:hypothetical protein
VPQASRSFGPSSCGTRTPLAHCSRICILSYYYNQWMVAPVDFGHIITFMAWPPFDSRVLQRGRRPARPRGASRRGAAPRPATFAVAEARQLAAAQDHGPSHARRRRDAGSRSRGRPGGSTRRLLLFRSSPQWPGRQLSAARVAARGGWRVLVRCASSSSVVLLCGGSVRRGTRTEAAVWRTRPLEVVDRLRVDF